MPIKIKNLAPKIIFITLNSGSSIRLSSRSVTSEIADGEIRGNPKIEKLMKLHLIAVEQIKEKPKPQKRKIAKTTAGTRTKPLSEKPGTVVFKGERSAESEGQK